MSATSGDFHICDACSLVIRPATAFAAHATSQEHLEKVQGNFIRCPVCTTFYLRTSWYSHVQGRPHRKSAERQGLRVNIPFEVPTAVPGHRKCNICAIFVRESEWNAHQQWSSHLRRVRTRQEVEAMRNTLRRAAVDKEDVTVHPPEGVNFGIVDVSDFGQAVRSVLRVNVSRDSGIVKLASAKLRPSSSLTTKTSFIAEVPLTPIHPDTGIDVVVCFRPSSPRIGQYSANIELLFEDRGRGKHFVIIRQVTAIVGSRDDYQAIAPTAPYQPRPRRSYRRSAATTIIPGERPQDLVRHPYKTKLGQYRIPQVLIAALEDGPEEVGQVLKRLPPTYRLAESNPANYVMRLKTQLWIEEYKATMDMHVFDMFDRNLVQNGSNYYLTVPGLAENRPSVIRGDSIMVQPQGGADDRWFEGVVHDVRSESVGVQFARSFRPSPGSTFSVRFTFNRVPLRRQHQALHRSFAQGRVLFPIEAHVRPPASQNTTLALFNNTILTNPAQLLAVKTVLALPPASHPFIIFGPPGTGKTVTIVEAILQLLQLNPTSKILACAPSNPAADLIAERLLRYMDKKKLFRFYAPSRRPDLSPAAVLECSYPPNASSFAVPDADYVSPFQVVVATCVGAAFALNIKMTPGHFNYIFIDEAGQGTEQEAMVSIKGMADEHTNIILSGDPKQLRPVIRSPVAAELGLGKSYLERLMDRAIYDEAQGHGRTLVKLVKNFRSHSQILDFPNRTFYGGDLQAHADPKVVDAFVQWKHLPQPTRRFPVVFHAVAGQDEREASSPSYFNRLEASQVKQYVQILLASGKVAAEDIGVITPYHAQAMKIRQLLKPFSSDTRVASVELFQGQERKVIIMSTVRSTQELMSYDLKHTLGFVGNPRRFNVAITRAQALLIVVGDPAVLGLDPLWRSWLNFVFTRGGWTGSNGPSWDPEVEVREAGGYDREIQELGLEEMRVLTARMEALSTGSNVVVEDDEAGAYEADARDTE